MSLYFASINSGSNGNCYYVGTRQEGVLVDAGISCRETEKRMRQLGLSMESIKGIFISHEHGDHIYGVEAICKRYGIPVFTNFSTGRQISKRIPNGLLQRIDSGTCITLSELSINAFSKLHDAVDPLSFTITGHQLTVGVFTDIGKVCENLTSHFEQCHAAFLECNYDEEMLENGKYPFHLKNRIKSDHGHLSNRQALELFEQRRPSFMTHLLLSHLSKENNHPQKALSYFEPHQHHTHIQVASRDGAGTLFQISPVNANLTHVPSTAVQTSLF